MSVSPLPVGGICFDRRQSNRASAAPVPLRLSSAHADAFAELLQVLACGEESAALAFDHLAESHSDSALKRALTAIAADENEHQFILQGLRESLPTQRASPALQGLMRRFFMRLADRDVRVHCVRIFAIDSAVCQLLGALRGRHKPICAEQRICAALARIHRDEARHVMIAKRCAAHLLGTTHGRDIAADARARLARVLEHRAAAMDILCVDPDRLFTKLRDLPR